MVLGLEALFIALSLGLFLGVIASLRQNQWVDHLAMAIAVIGISIPSFILATFLQYLLALKLGWFPVARWGNIPPLCPSSHLFGNAPDSVYCALDPLEHAGIPEQKDEHASQAYAENGIVQRAIWAIKEAAPDLIVITDVCLCEYMSHGHCGVVAAEGGIFRY